ncbi:ankyrin repeat domain-containing protein [Bradyrhizobium arachidis]|jgi:ankyrin repeat protein|uniref:Ankyrin repeat domain-containing protein n=1 Tax=Bradyrhizobium arachidis TaxID=858423 RepID=A0AAE7NIZ3_9BRAD|nr:ankyrin repeat domain-containing protein [Bradyrhizobium arachidis]QOZ65882.1 ankyrin repeat domain-containing protein [Bradyrhizobium arachidis]SFV18976.1 Ankyrin repeat-containing protein [Bradyrhizobium arachidis]
MKNIFSRRRKRFDPNLSNDEGQSFLHRYAAHLNLTGIEVFIACGADINKQDNIGMTPLHYAAFNGQLPALRALFNAGANPSLRTIDGRSVADIARAGNHELVARYARKHFPG